MLSAKDSKTARTASLFAALLLVGVSFFPAFLGTKVSGDMAGFLSGLPSVPGALLVVRVLGAIMSTADSLLSAAASHIVVDLISAKNDKKQLTHSRISVLAFGLLALLISFVMPTIIDAIVFSYTIYTAAVFFPLILGIL